MKSGRCGRTAATAAVAAVVLLAGCGGGGGITRAHGDGGAAGPAQATASPVTGAALSAVLSEKQVAGALPGGAAVSGLKNGMRSAVPARDPGTGACVAGEDEALCAGAVTMGASVFVTRGEANVNFALTAYQDRKAAAAAYALVLKRDQADRAQRDVALGAVGERRHGRLGTFGTTGDPHARATVLVGTTVLSIDAFGKAKYVSGERLAAYATMFVERSEQALQQAAEAGP